MLEIVQVDGIYQIKREKYIQSKLLLDKIKNEIVLGKKKTHFLIPQKYSDNKHLLKLIDLRALHVR